MNGTESTRHRDPACCLLAAIVTLLLGTVTGRAAETWTLHSPDEQVAVTVCCGDQLTYEVTFRGEPVVLPSKLGIAINGHDLGTNVVQSGEVRTGALEEHYSTRGVHSTAVNRYRSMVLSLRGSAAEVPWQLEFRAFNDGVAYRYRVPGGGTRRVVGESSEWALPADTVVWYQDAANRSYEARYASGVIGTLPAGLRMMTPATVKFAADGGYGLVTEANLVRYSDMALQVADGNRLAAVFQDNLDGWQHDGEFVSPWRATLLTSDLNSLVNSDLVKNLCPPPAPERARAKWNRPGRSTWHWLTGGAPKLEEQPRWIDGAEELGYEYHLIDDGWRIWNGGGENAWRALAEVVRYAKRHGVDIWVWVDATYVFAPADRTEYFRRAKSIGVVGLKIDFPHPANYEWVGWYEDTLRAAAAAELMIDFHGAVKPTGLERTWPNEMTREAICGREQGKLPAAHDTALPFIRYVQGHADYTPTLFIPERLDGSSFAHELAMAVVFTSPFLCLGDNPSHYLASDARDVLEALPPVWDETIVLPESEIGQLAAFARRRGNEWFIGVINGETPRQLVVPLSFLGSRSYGLVGMADDPDRNDTFVRSKRAVNSKDQLTVPLRGDGGYVGWLRPLDEPTGRRQEHAEQIRQHDN